MSEEEIEAIERQKNNIEIVLFETRGDTNGEMYITMQDLKIILNLIEKLQKENQELKEVNKKINKVADKMYEYISYYGWEDFESNTGCNREEMVDYFYKE